MNICRRREKATDVERWLKKPVLLESMKPAQKHKPAPFKFLLFDSKLSVSFFFFFKGLWGFKISTETGEGEREGFRLRKFVEWWVPEPHPFPAIFLEVLVYPARGKTVSSSRAIFPNKSYLFKRLRLI